MAFRNRRVKENKYVYEEQKKKKKKKKKYK